MCEAELAEALNAKDADEMRSGFTMEFFNQRGVHGFSAGEEEKKLAAGFNAKADALEEKGYQRIATAVRELAKTMSEMPSGKQNEIRMEIDYDSSPGPLLVGRGEGEKLWDAYPG